MGHNLFSVPIFFIVFRETLEAAIIVSVLLGLAEQIVHDGPSAKSPRALTDHTTTTTTTSEGTALEKHDIKESTGSSSGFALDPAHEPELLDDDVKNKRLLRKLRIQIFLGAGIGLFVALAIGAAFIAVWFSKASDLWSKSETLWEATFRLIASLMIFVMGVTMLKMDRAKAKWRVKLEHAFEGDDVDRSTQTGKWALFFLPFVTVLREGMEAVVFVGGVSLGQSASSIPIAAIVGLLCGITIGYAIYQFASRATLTAFLIFMTNFLLLIGAGLFSGAVAGYQANAFNHLLGADVDDLSSAGNGPGSYNVKGNVWHLDCCNPEHKLDGQGWNIFAAIFGWNNNASVGTILAYIFYWLAVIACLIALKFREGRTKLAGFESGAGRRRRQGREEKERSSRSTL